MTSGTAQRLPHRRAGASFGDVAILLAALTLVLAASWPAARARAAEERTASLLARVDAAVASAEEVRERSGAWPVPGPVAPPAGTHAEPVLEWRRLTVAGEPASTGLPPLEQVGLLFVHGAEEPQLDALLDRYGTARSFVLGQSWILVLSRFTTPAR